MFEQAKTYATNDLLTQLDAYKRSRAYEDLQRILNKERQQRLTIWSEYLPHFS